MNDLVGRTFLERYKVEALIASGGTGSVYRAWDLRRNVALAIKVLAPQLCDDPAFLRQFRAEAEALANLQHPNIVRFYSLEQVGDMAFIVMDYVGGSTLRQEILDRAGPLPAQRILEVMRDACAALNYAHQLGYVHCDIKPGNILISESGKAVVSDFGIARLAGRAAASKGTAGTAAYMAPEQVRNEAPTHATDIYALGIVLYEMLTGGQRPFAGRSAGATGATTERIRWEQMYATPTAPRHYNPALNPELEAVVLRCLAKDTRQRYTSALALQNAVERQLRAQTVKPISRPIDRKSSASAELKPLQEREPAQPTRRPNNVAMLAVIAVAAAVVILALALAGHGLQPPPQARGVAPTIGTRPFTILPYEGFASNAECLPCLLANWEDPREPGLYPLNVDFPAGRPLLISLHWCARDQLILEQNWSIIQFDDVVIDGQRIRTDQLQLVEIPGTNDFSCRGYRGVLREWSAGRHRYTETMRIAERLNDGENEYQPGEYIYDYSVNVR